MVYMYHSFLIHSSADGHLGCFHVLAMINCCNEHWGARVSFRSCFLGVYAQKWDCWVIWQFHFQFFKKSPQLVEEEDGREECDPRHTRCKWVIRVQKLWSTPFNEKTELSCEESVLWVAKTTSYRILPAIYWSLKCKLVAKLSTGVKRSFDSFEFLSFKNVSEGLPWWSSG